ncbi:hypothetical protein Leryth_010654 [Lithospermum erythrorhizon]|nr:hypothetical protein Leryth_010654 [Lithospermum erythrorhizon]
MAIPALTSLLESVRFLDSRRAFEDEHVKDNIELSLKFIIDVAEEICNDEGSKVVVENIENIRSKALLMEYFLELLISKLQSSDFAGQQISDIVLAVEYDGQKITDIESAAKEIFSMSSGLLLSFSPMFPNCRSELLHYRPCTVLNFEKIIGRYISVLLRSPDLESITLSGMKCIERRALARQIFCNYRIVNLFVRVWLTVLSGDTARDLLQRLMCRFIHLFPDKELDQMSNEELCDCLSESLEGKRYLIVIDNLQCYEAWDEIRSSFPDNKKRSKILFTTTVVTERIVADPVVSSTSMKLDPSVDDKMFDHLVFGGRSFPQELELIKLDILFCCQWSPPAVIMIAKYLSTINPTVDNWVQVRRRLKHSHFVSNLKYDDFVINPQNDDSITTILSILELSEKLGSTNLENTIFDSDEFDQERRNQLEGISHHEADEDNELISPVGVEEFLERLVSDLVKSSPLVEKLAIVGMAGIGKTTLAGRIFYDQRVSYHFDIRAWVRISPVYCKRDLLLQLLHCINQSRTDDTSGGDDCDLEELLYKSLKRRRYLIVMDDMWSRKAWTELKRIFPDDNTGSRVLITSRQRDEMEFLNCTSIHQMSLLSDNRSWDLIQEKVFGQDPCPSDLVETGKHIAKNCNGLPLAIVVVAGLLLKIGKTLEDWKAVAESVRLWIAEGFIVQKSQISLEDVAEDYLNDLIGRSILLAGRKRLNERVKTSHMHDLLQEFCIQEARKEKFMNLITDCRQIHSEGSIDTRCRFSFHCEIYGDIDLTTSKSRAGSALFFRDCPSVVADILLYYFDFKWLKVLDIISLRFDTFPVEQISKLLLLRYLAFTASFELPSIVFELRKLETLVVNGPWFRSPEIPVLPHEFWRCTNLRHLQLRVATHLFPLEIPILTSDLPYLLTLSRVTLSSCTSSKFAGIFSIIKLGVCETHEDSIIDGLWEIFFQDLVLLKHVQTLKLACFGRNTRPLPMPSHNAFPHSLKKLTLWRSYLTWKTMTSLAELPSLEVLKLRNYAFQGPEWKTVEGGFQRLKYLLIEETDLEVWNLEGSHFPHLRCLVLKFCNKLHELPNEVGDIYALRRIELHFCSTSAEQSAKDIQEEQLIEYCNDIEVLIRTHRTRSTSSVQA